MNFLKTTCIIGITGFFFFIFFIFLLHILHPEFDPLKRYISEYVTGTFGWILNVGLIGNSIGIISLISALHKSFKKKERSSLGMICLYIVAIFMCANFFPADFKGLPLVKALENNVYLQIHYTGGLIATFAMFISMFTISIKIRRLGLLKNNKLLLIIAATTPVLLILQVIIFDILLDSVGLGQRIFSFVMILWPVVLLWSIISKKKSIQLKAPKV